jgi:hypothetical protein
MPLNNRKSIIYLFGGKYFLWLITIISFVFAWAFSIEMRKQSKQIKVLKKEELFYKSLTSEGYLISLYSQIYLNKDLWKELNLFNLSDEKKVPFQKLVSKTSLVLFIHSDMCTPCVEHEIKNFLGLHKNHGFDINNSLVIIAGYKKEVIQKNPTFSPILSFAYYIPRKEVASEFKNLTKPCMVLFKSGYPNLVYLSSGSQDAYFEVWKSFVLKSGI